VAAAAPTAKGPALLQGGFVEIQKGFGVKDLIASDYRDAAGVLAKIDADADGERKSLTRADREGDLPDGTGPFPRVWSQGPLGDHATPLALRLSELRCRGRLCLDPPLGYGGENGGVWASFTLGRRFY